MINTKELRRGNLVIVMLEGKQYYCVVDIIEEKRVCVDWAAHMFYGNGMMAGWTIPENIFRIQLSDDWLLRMGFEFYGESRHVPGKNNTIIFRMWGDGPRYFQKQDGGEIRIHCMHQLQNLYFAFTGHELTIKSNT